ncbi:hypothetical protein C4D60_Mb05t23390 [Musa balbisiana]|uniref:Uncharacterized protein n=1 Tax=Musa balbisiana TaxID=52838 RepID=A0A4S8JYA8_MUSBA|nr:hypothetical protein C4D60_Mb05t23390 [Musa balbisiana]
MQHALDRHLDSRPQDSLFIRVCRQQALVVIILMMRGTRKVECHLIGPGWEVRGERIESHISWKDTMP